MIELVIGPILSACLGGLSAFIGAWFAFSNKIAKLEVMVGNLTSEVNKHNKVIERTYRLEERMDSALHSLDEVKDEVHRYHHN
ncbi:MAG: hypothetical protein IJO87_10510 [Eggerthellaceae bacterium]|nr:hypothetical protein [Eggerthellaceae bacterium]